MNDLIAVKRLAEWERMKALVLGSVSSSITRRVYSMAMGEFMDWYQRERGRVSAKPQSAPGEPHSKPAGQANRGAGALRHLQ